MSGQWDRIEAMLGDRIGLDPVAVGPSVIPRAVRARMNELGLADVDCYSSLLSSSEVELQALIEEVIVPESWFFRDEVPFRHFQDHVRSRWVANPAQPPPAHPEHSLCRRRGTLLPGDGTRGAWPGCRAVSGHCRGYQRPAAGSRSPGHLFKQRLPGQ